MAAAHPGFDEADVGRQLIGLRRRLARGADGDGEDERQHVVVRLGHHCEREAGAAAN